MMSSIAKNEQERVQTQQYFYTGCSLGESAEPLSVTSHFPAIGAIFCLVTVTHHPLGVVPYCAPISCFASFRFT